MPASLLLQRVVSSLGLFGVMEKFSAIAGPLIFAAAAQIFGSSRPAILFDFVFHGRYHLSAAG